MWCLLLSPGARPCVLTARWACRLNSGSLGLNAIAAGNVTIAAGNLTEDAAVRMPPE
jgi:hypothetical protein